LVSVDTHAGGEGSHAPLPAIEIERAPTHAPGFAAIVWLRGEHDLDSSVAIREALDSVDGDVLIDLAGCGFMDSAVIGTLLRLHQNRARGGSRLELVVPPENRIIARTIEVASLRELITVHERVPARPRPH
jgi:anti-anti-sigma factor